MPSSDTCSTSGGSGWTPPSIEELQQLLPQFEVESILGKGGMGAVYKGKQTALQRAVAIKVLPETLIERDNSHQYVERFKLEARAMASLDHPAIISVFDFGQTAAGQLYFVMEYIDGMDIEQYIAASGGTVDPDHATAIVSHVLDALDYAHSKGVVHRDIKPANVLIDRDGRVKIADFGLAKKVEGEAADRLGLTMTDMAVGTPDYIAPEAFDTELIPDGRADLYAVGVMFYRMLTGKLPRGIFKLPSEQIPGLDGRFDEIIEMAMESDPNGRFQRASEFRSKLDELQSTPVTRIQPQQETGLVSPAVSAPANPRTEPEPEAVKDVKKTLNTGTSTKQPHPKPTRSSGRASGFTTVVIVAALLIGAAVFGVLKLRDNVEGIESPSMTKTETGNDSRPPEELSPVKQNPGLSAEQPKAPNVAKVNPEIDPEQPMAPNVAKVNPEIDPEQPMAPNVAKVNPEIDPEQPKAPNVAKVNPEIDPEQPMAPNVAKVDPDSENPKTAHEISTTPKPTRPRRPVPPTDWPTGPHFHAAGNFRSWSSTPDDTTMMLDELAEVDDAIEVWATEVDWVVLRENGETISMNENAVRKNIRKICPGFGEVYGMITTDGRPIVIGGRESVTSIPKDIGPIKDAFFSINFAVALLEDGSLLTWGSAFDPNSMDDQAWAEKPALPAGKNAVAIAVSARSMVVELDDGSLIAFCYEWGAVELPREFKSSRIKDFVVNRNYAYALGLSGRITAKFDFTEKMSMPTDIGKGETLESLHYSHFGIYGFTDKGRPTVSEERDLGLEKGLREALSKVKPTSPKYFSLYCRKGVKLIWFEPSPNTGPAPEPSRLSSKNDSNSTPAPDPAHPIVVGATISPPDIPAIHQRIENYQNARGEQLLELVSSYLQALKNSENGARQSGNLKQVESIRKAVLETSAYHTSLQDLAISKKVPLLPILAPLDKTVPDSTTRLRGILDSETNRIERELHSKLDQSLYAIQSNLVKNNDIEAARAVEVYRISLTSGSDTSESPAP